MKKIFITGGSGTVGSSFIKKYYNKYKFYSYCRNEKSQVSLKRRFPDIEIVLGSVEDYPLLASSIVKIKPDIIIHAAALKHVDTAEKQPQQAILANIIGSYNVIKAAQWADVKTTVGISTDKACLPDCVYGYTKLMMEKMFIEANNDKNKFVCCRFGNVAGSHGSVIPFWLTLKSKGLPLKITDTRMTRLMFSQEDAAELVQKCIDDSKDNDGFVLSKKMKKVNMYDLTKVISEDVEIIGIRPGEKLDEDLISKEELPYTEVEGEYIFLRPEVNEDNSTRLSGALSSETADKMTEEEMKEMVVEVENIVYETLISEGQY